MVMRAIAQHMRINLTSGILIRITYLTMIIDERGVHLNTPFRYLRGFIVGLYQNHSANEPLPLRLLSGHEPVYLYAWTDSALSGEAQPALPGPDGYLRGSAPGGV